MDGDIKLRSFALVALIILSVCGTGTGQESGGGAVVAQRTNTNPRIKILQTSSDASETLSPSLIVVKAGAPVIVRYTLQNDSTRPIALGAFQNFEVKTETGDLAPETPTGCFHHFFSPCFNNSDRLMSGVRGELLQPGKSLTGQLEVRTGYDLSRPGTYTISGVVCGVTEMPNTCIRSTNQVKLIVR
jgi:hypothetical protein